MYDKQMVKNIDFNCDLAQSYGIYTNDSEFRLLDYVSSVNISCGFHAGDPLTIKNALLKAKEKNIVIGAHIGYDDIQGCGYRKMNLSEDELEALVMYQVGAMMAFAKAYHMDIEHVRPHGAMYVHASDDISVSKTIARAIKKCSQWLVYYGAAGAELDEISDELNIKVAHEAHLEKIYNKDGKIIFSAKDLENTDVSIQRLRNLLNKSQVSTDLGDSVVLPKIDTIHFSNKLSNVEDLLIRAKSLVEPLPYNYKEAQTSGWV